MPESQDQFRHIECVDFSRGHAEFATAARSRDASDRAIHSDRLEVRLILRSRHLADAPSSVGSATEASRARLEAIGLENNCLMPETVMDWVRLETMGRGETER